MKPVISLLFAATSLLAPGFAHSQPQPGVSPEPGTSSVRRDRPTGVAPGTYVCPTLTIDAGGRIISATNGTCSGMLKESGRTLMTADRHYYYNCLTGSNSNPGTSEAPFADPAHAYKFDQQTLDHAGKYTTIVHQQGSCTPAMSPDPYGWPVGWLFVGPLFGALGVDSFRITGEGIGPIVNGSEGGYVFESLSDAAITVANLNCVPGPKGGCWLSANGLMKIENVWGATNGANSLIDAAGPRSVVEVRNLVLRAMGAPMNTVVIMEDGAWANMRGEWIMSGIPAFYAFVQADISGIIDLTGFSSSGEASGHRAAAYQNGVVFTDTKGIAVLPGSMDGVSDTGGRIQ